MIIADFNVIYVYWYLGNINIKCWNFIKYNSLKMCQCRTSVNDSAVNISTSPITKKRYQEGMWIELNYHLNFFSTLLLQVTLVKKGYCMKQITKPKMGKFSCYIFSRDNFKWHLHQYFKITKWQKLNGDGRIYQNNVFDRNKMWRLSC